MYRCPDFYDDGLAVDFRSPDLDISECIRQIQGRALRFDVISADPWNEYETSWRDLNTAFDLITDGGTFIVHDCLPPREEVATPHVTWGEWWGLTYKVLSGFRHHE